jgi:four helix bundle protein
VVLDGDGIGDVVGKQLFSGTADTLAMLSFQRLDVYQRSVEFVALSVELTNRASRGSGPILEQLRRAATSIPLNIAEAAGRTGRADVARCYAIARGSAMECAAILDTLRILQVVEPDRYQSGLELLERIVAMLTKLCR